MIRRLWTWLIKRDLERAMKRLEQRDREREQNES